MVVLLLIQLADNFAEPLLTWQEGVKSYFPEGESTHPSSFLKPCKKIKNFVLNISLDLIMLWHVTLYVITILTVYAESCLKCRVTGWNQLHAFSCNNLCTFMFSFVLGLKIQNIVKWRKINFWQTKARKFGIRTSIYWNGFLSTVWLKQMKKLT